MHRIALLREFAAIRYPRDPRYPSPAEIRAEFQAEASPCRSRVCFACYVSRVPLVTHHIIQIQHGGTNERNNRVTLCHACHRLLHPWLKFTGAVRSALDRGDKGWRP